MGKIYFSLPELNNSAQGSQINTLLAKFPGTALKKPFFLKKLIFVLLVHLYFRLFLQHIHILNAVAVS